MYKIQSNYNLITGEKASPVAVIRLMDGAAIPFDPANVDAVEFAKWLQEGGIPEPSTEGEVVTQEWIDETIAKLLPNG
jgi:hypothetical protein